MTDITGRREQVAAWLTANGIDPNDVPLDGPITEDSRGDGTPVIRYTVLVREDGHRYATTTGPAAREDRETPLLVPWRPGAPWTADHRLTLLRQVEVRAGEGDQWMEYRPTDRGDQWMECRPTGRVLAACNCGYTSGWVRPAELPDAAGIYAEHSNAAPDTLVVRADDSPDRVHEA